MRRLPTVASAKVGQSLPDFASYGWQANRAFPEDAKANAEFSKRKLSMPVLGIGGAGSFGPLIGEHLRHVATDVRAVEIRDSGHWVA